MKKIYTHLVCILLVVFFIGIPITEAQDSSSEISIVGHLQIGFTPPIPISISGITGEALEVLEFDLYVQGFKVVPADQAQYEITGSSNGDIVGRVTDKYARKEILARSYTGAGIRREAHWFADDIVNATTGKQGIGKTKIAFKVQSPDGNGEIYVSDFDGHNPQAVTTDGAIVAAPAWVPGHLALYYTSYKLGNPDIFYQNLATGQRSVFASYAGLNTSAAVSPDGSKVAMVLSRSGDPNVWVCDADGSHLKQLTHTRADDSSPCWSPDGQWICYATKIHSRRQLAKISVDGGEPQVLSTSGAPNPTEPDWSPDGKWIAFTSQAGEFDICVMPAEGGAPVALVEGQHPSWSPNSRTLVYNQDYGYRQTLSVLDVFTKQHKNAQKVIGNDSEAAWAR